MISKRYTLRTSPNLYSGIVEHLKRSHGFCDLYYQDNYKCMKNKLSLVIDIIRDIYFTFKVSKTISNANTVIGFSYMGLAVVILTKMKLINVRNKYWYGLFLHSPKAIKLLGYLLKLFDDGKTLFVVFSKYEIALYSKYLKLPDDRFRYIPLPYYPPNPEAKTEFTNNYKSKYQSYYFSGGYSNRDYIALINAFRDVKENLIIACSHLNTEIENIKIPDNISIIYDIKTYNFIELLMGSKACILPMKSNTGAAGQMVVADSMYLKKVIIASNTDIIKEYIDDGITGILLGDIMQDLPKVIRDINLYPNKYQQMGERAYKSLINRYSKEMVYNEVSRLVGSQD
ncbi:MAG: glycosyltransferase [bacterium]